MLPNERMYKIYFFNNDLSSRYYLPTIKLMRFFNSEEPTIKIHPYLNYVP